MKILHVMNELRPSGAEVMLELAAPFWLKLGCELHLLAIADQKGPQAERLAAAGWSIGQLSRRGGTAGLVRNLAEYVRNLSPDIVHLHQEGKALPLAYAVSRTGVPMCRTVHNNFPFTGRLRIQKSVERWFCRLLGSQHIAISSSVQSNELNRFHNPTCLCWNWFNESSFTPPSPQERIEARARLGIPLDQRMLLTIGNGSDIKNYRVVIESMAHLQVPDVHYYQVGNPHPNSTDLNTARLLNLGERVHLMGPRHDVLDWLWACDVYLMPSIFEGYGLAAVEAIASACRCLFADCPGLADFKSFGIQAAWLAPEAKLMAQTLNTWLCEKPDWDTLHRNARTIRSAFGVENRSRAYFDVWASLLASSQS